MLRYGITIVLICLNVGAFSLKVGECPPLENIPCTCNLHTGHANLIGDPYIECHAPLVSKSELNVLMKVLKGYKLGALSFVNTTVIGYDEDLFKGLHTDMLVLEELSVREEVFKTDFRQLQGMENSLRLLTIRNSYYNGVPLKHLQLDHLHKLQSVMLHENNILEVGNDWFANGPKSLETLLFDRNDIQHIGDKAFHALENLRVLWIRGSNLKEIKRSMLPLPAPMLFILDISSNQLTELPADLFSNMPGLGVLALQNNLLKTLPQNIFPKIITLFIDGNPLNCDKDLKWICQTSNEIEDTECASPSQWAGNKLTNFCSA